MDGKNSDEDARFRALANQLPAVVWSTDTSLCFTSGNGGALASLGLSPNQIRGVSLYAYFGTQDEQHVAIQAHRKALAGESCKFEIQWSERWYETYVEPFREASGAIVGTLGMAIDMTARKRAEDEQSRVQDQLRRQYKLEAIGQLARGLAHEINNPLQSIINFAQLIRARSNDETVREYSDGISQEVQGLASIVRNLQCLVHQKSELPVELRLKELVQGTLSLFATLMREDGIRLEIRMPEDLRPAWGNASGVQQVLINLLMAARDALLGLPASERRPKQVAISAAIATRAGQASLRLTVEHTHRQAVTRKSRAKRPSAHAGAADHELALSISQEIAHFNAGELEVVLGPQQRAFHLFLPLASEQ